MRKTKYELGPFGTNLIGEWLEYRGEDHAYYMTKILCTCDDKPRPYIFTDVDSEYSDRYSERGVRCIHPEIPFWDCMCHNVPGDLYNMRRFRIEDRIWDG